MGVIASIVALAFVALAYLKRHVWKVSLRVSPGLIVVLAVSFVVTLLALLTEGLVITIIASIVLLLGIVGSGYQAFTVIRARKAYDATNLEGWSDSELIAWDDAYKVLLNKYYDEVGTWTTEQQQDFAAAYFNLAMSRSTHPAVLQFMAQQEASRAVLEQLAKNESTPPKALAIIGAIMNEYPTPSNIAVVRALRANPNTPSSVTYNLEG